MPRALLTIALFASAASALAQELPERPYPQGEAFPLGSFSLQPVEDFPAVREFGWNFGHRYNFEASYLDATLAGGLYSLASIPRPGEDVTWDTIRERIVEYAAYENLVWWNLPEELRYWEPAEQEMLERIPQLTRELDPMQRPNFMYMPTHVTSGRIARDAPYLDIIGAGGYTEYHHMPRSWQRYAIEREVEGIGRAGLEVGPDYLAGQKTPIAVLQLFYSPQKMDVIAPIEATHDFWASIAAGARGVLVFSYWHKRDGGGMLEGTWDAYCREAAKITGEERLGAVILFGEPYEDVSFGIVRGPRMSAPFEPYGYNHEVRYPSLTVRAWSFEGNLYVLAVNSAERGVTAIFRGLPGDATEAEVLFEAATPEEEGAEPVRRVLPISGGSLEDNFAGLGVHIYRVRMP